MKQKNFWAFLGWLSNVFMVVFAAIGAGWEMFPVIAVVAFAAASIHSRLDKND